MDNYTPQRPKKRVSRKVLRRRQMTALGVIALLVLLMVILIAKCAKGDPEENESAVTTTTTTTTTVEITPAVTTQAATEAETTTTAVENAAAAKVQLSKREMYLDVGETDVSIISSYPSGSSEANEVWKSSDDKIATVNDLGYVTAVAPGECYIILSFDNNPGVEIEIKVSVADGGAPLTAGSGSENPVSDETNTTVSEEGTTDAEGVSAQGDPAEGGVVGLSN
ncbi:MAG: Ig-like domain-containing protein [Ruminococcus sp.]|nr:Ig-like domain-containing protein [Ruminococcus sp.]MBQ3914977.1 Ig-like domain-containing protein [Ruminococcus sp.]